MMKRLYSLVELLKFKEQKINHIVSQMGMDIMPYAYTDSLDTARVLEDVVFDNSLETDYMMWLPQVIGEEKPGAIRILQIRRATPKQIVIAAILTLQD